MTRPVPHVLVQAVIRAENGSRYVEIDCPACDDVHSHDWPVGKTIVGYRMSVCGKTPYYIDVPGWAQTHHDLHGYGKRNHLDDNAIHVPANNWRNDK